MNPPNQPNRRFFDWTKISGPRDHFAVWSATALGAGFAPFAPGTAGTIVALPLVYFSNDWQTAPRLFLWCAVMLLGTWAAKVIDSKMHSQDNQNIVIDEVLGMGITGWTAGHNLRTLGVAFFLFRLLDSIKPPPIRQVDNWSHSHTEGANPDRAAWWTGFGVMADDVVAAFEGLLLILIAQHYGWLS